MTTDAGDDQDNQPRPEPPPVADGDSEGAVRSNEQFNRRRESVQADLSREGVEAGDLTSKPSRRAGNTYIYHIKNAGAVVHRLDSGSFAASFEGSGTQDPPPVDFDAFAKDSAWPEGVFRAHLLSPVDLAYLITLTLLEGCPQVELRAAHDRLSAALAEYYPTPKDSPPYIPGSSRSGMVRALRCVRFIVDDQIASGGPERVGFPEPVDRQRALDFIFSGDLPLPPGGGEVIATWVQELGAASTLEVRQSVGRAVGSLAKGALDYYWRRFVETWALKSAGDALDAACAAILWAYDGSASAQARIRDHLQVWANCERGRRGMAAATRVACDALLDFESAKSSVEANFDLVGGVARRLLDQSSTLGMILSERCYSAWLRHESISSKSASPATIALGDLRAAAEGRRTREVVCRDIVFLALSEIEGKDGSADATSSEHFLRAIQSSDEAIAHAGALFASALANGATSHWALRRLQQITLAEVAGELDLERTQTQLFNAIVEVSGRPELRDLRRDWMVHQERLGSISPGKRVPT